METVALRRLNAPSREKGARLSQLPEDDPEVITIEDHAVAELVIFGLGRIIVDDFGEVLVLCGNGYGIGALKVLRGMYERLVTAEFIAKNPSEARAFVEDDAIKKWKLWQQGRTVIPELENTIAKEEIEALAAEYKRVKAKRAESICNKCGQPKTQEAWTRFDLATMAKQAPIGLSALYGACYLTPTFHSHATGFGLAARFQDSGEDAVSYLASSEGDARQALCLAHNLLLQSLGLQNEYFDLGLAGEIQRRIDAFSHVWGPQQQGGSETTSNG